MIGLLLRLYPAHWRHRYSEEFRAVLESRPLGPFDVADVLIGALDARLTRFRFAGAAEIAGGPVVMLRLGGLGAVAGGTLWFLGLAVSSAFGGDGAWITLMAIGSIGILLALIGLSAFQAYRAPVLAWAAFAIPAIGSAVSAIGAAAMALGPADGAPILGSFDAWSIWILGLMATVVGSILFAVATFRAAVFSRRAAVALAVTSAATLVVMFGSMGLVSVPPDVGRLLVAVITGSFAASWITLGILALRRGPIRAVAPA